MPDKYAVQICLGRGTLGESWRDVNHTYDLREAKDAYNYWHGVGRIVRIVKLIDAVSEIDIDAITEIR